MWTTPTVLAKIVALMFSVNARVVLFSPFQHKMKHQTRKLFRAVVPIWVKEGNGEGERTRFLSSPIKTIRGKAEREMDQSNEIKQLVTHEMFTDLCLNEGDRMLAAGLVNWHQLSLPAQAS